MKWFGKHPCISALHAFIECTEGFNLCSEKQISKLGIGKEDNEEHNSKAQNVRSAAGQSRRQLGHGLVKTDILEYLWVFKQNRSSVRFFLWISKGLKHDKYDYLNIVYLMDLVLPWSRQRTNWLHSYCCTVFAKMPEIQNLHIYQAVPKAFQVICPPWLCGKHWRQWQQLQAVEDKGLVQPHVRNEWVFLYRKHNAVKYITYLTRMTTISRMFQMQLK